MKNKRCKRTGGGGEGEGEGEGTSRRPGEKALLPPRVSSR